MAKSSERLGEAAWAELRGRLARSRFRARFDLTAEDAACCRARGLGEIRAHAARFVRERLAPAHPPNDGRQTPMRGHPVFRAQHGTATCCRGCLAKWHGIPRGRALTEEEVRYVVAVLLQWIAERIDAPESPASEQGSLF